MGSVSLIDADRQWFKARCGFDDLETARDISFCTHAVAADDTLVVRDALLDSRFIDNPFVVDAPHVRFYAGVPLRASAVPGGPPLPIGTLCVIGDEPQDPSPENLEMLRGLGRVVEALLESRRTSSRNLRLALERQQALIEIERTQRLLQQAERMARVGSWRLDLNTKVAHWSPQTYAIHGLDVGEDPSLQTALDFYPAADRVLLDAAIANCVGSGRSWDMECDFFTATGDLRRVRTMGEPELRDGRPVAIIGVIQDITDRYRLERRLHEVAHTDELTGLATRRAFNNRLDAAIAKSQTDASQLTVAILDLDRFKDVNDRLGHAAGDEVLRLMAAKLRGVTYLGEFFGARLGGDEFVLLLQGAAARERLVPSIERLLGDLRHDVPADHGSIAVSTTIGACIVDAENPDRSSVLKCADQALYRAKRLRRGTGAIAGRAGLINAAGYVVPITRTA
ncbi:diguanylate cyclase [Sphingomonas radiodurans]|nr:diguanylate cyclase [Sphingomonas radiodurans]WBH18218.1 diguanylate cyclase [Sphingomonas radiodurans]